MSPTVLVIRVLLALMLTMALVIVWVLWYYRPTIEYASDGSLGSGMASFSIGLSLPRLLTFFALVLILFGLTKVSWVK